MGKSRRAAVKQPILGAHMSIAGGYYKAVLTAREHECDCVQIFTKNNNQWRAKPITDEDVDQFQQALREQSIPHTLSHASYLINVASPDPELRSKSVQALVVELQRAERLGIPYVVLHPGSYTTSSEKQGIRRVCQSINKAYRAVGEARVRLLLETTAGQGSNLGWRFEQLAAMLEGLNDPDATGICFDTCHVFAAGYAINTAEGYQQTLREFDSLIGLPRIRAFHLNDSKSPLGSRKDRHEHIGQGTLGLDAFRFLLSDPRFRDVPMYLETPKGTRDQDALPWDLVNIRQLRALVA